MFGYLNVLGTYFILYWQTDPEARLETLVDKYKPLSGRWKVDAYRCSKCQLLVFSYEKSGIDAYKERQEYRETPKTEEYTDVEKYLR
jgi:hypothetical protein